MDGEAASPTGSFKAEKQFAVEEWVQQRVRQLLAAHGGNITHAARASGQDPRVLRRMMRRGKGEARRVKREG